MSEAVQASIVIVLTLGGVLLVNAMILMTLRRNNANSEWKILKRMGQAARQPFARQDAQMEELSRKVAELREQTPPSPPPSQEQS